MIKSSKYFLKLFILNFVVIYVLLSNNTICQDMGIGQPFIKTYTNENYNSSRINWCIIQDKRGVVYAGNENGIIEFDGSSWRKIDVPNSEVVRTMDIDEDGRIYVCAAADFGFLEADSQGLLQYKSLLQYLDKKYHNFGEMWDVITSSHGIYFKNDDKVFRWNGTKITVWDSIYAFRLYNINDKIYSRNQDTGLMFVEGDSIKLMPDGEYFSDIGVYNMLPFLNSKNEEKILITTTNNGLFLHDGQKFHPFKTEVDTYLSDNHVYNACLTSDDKIAIATLRGGVIIIDKNGRLQKIINKNNGLPTDVVYDVWSNPTGGLWLATIDGIHHIEFPSSFSVLNKSHLQEDQPNSVIRFEDRLYIANTLGILNYSPSDNSFNLLKGIDREAQYFLNANGTLICAFNGGIAVIKENRIAKTIDKDAYVLYNSKVFRNRVYAGSSDGFFVLQKEDKDNFKINYSKELYSPVFEFAEDIDGGLWINGLFRGLYHLTGDLNKLENGSEEDIRYEFFSIKDDLPGLIHGIYNIQDRVLLSTDNGVFMFDKQSNRFLRDSTLGDIFFDSTFTISLLQKHINNDFWVIADSAGQMDLGKAILQNDGKYKWEPIPEFRRLNLNSIVSLYPEYSSVNDQEVLWIVSEEALILHNPNAKKNVDADFTSLIRKVYVNTDSLIYGGSENSKKSDEINAAITYSNNNIGFEFSATAFDKPESNEFQHFLKGNDKEWSQWTKTTKKEYTNLSSGDYTFHLRSKNVYGKISTSELFNFSILSPWYLTWWAYSIYIFIIGFGIFITDRIMRAKIIKRERNKAKLVEAELRAESAELQAKAAEAQARVIQAENDRKTKELEEARQLQLSMLPKELPKLPYLEIAVYMKTATEVGGDYYDFAIENGGPLNVSIGDATGHGMQAGTLVTLVKGLFTSEASGKEILNFFNDTSRTIKKINLGRIMMAFSLLKINKNQLQFSSAGMPPMYIYRNRSCSVDEVDMQGMPLGAMKNFRYKLFQTELFSGDCLLLLSDGYPELANSNSEQIGYERLKKQFADVSHMKPAAIIEYFNKLGSEWVNGKDPDDDITFVVIKVK